MTDFTLPGWLKTGNHASRPSSGLAYGSLYSCTTHSLVYQTTDGGATWSTWATLGTFTDPMTTRGDMIIRDSSNVTARLAIGSSGKVLQTVNGTDPVWGFSAPILGCKVYNSTTQSFNATTLTTITFDSEEYDTATMHDTGSNTGRLVAPVAGKYCVKAGIWYATTTGTNYVLFDKNGAASYIRGGATAQNGGGSGMFLATDIMLAANDYITVVGYHTEAGSIATGDTGTTPSQQNWASMHLIGI